MTHVTARRGFLKSAAGAATGIVFCGCGLLGPVRARAQGSRHPPVMLKGRRVRTIDVHSHCQFREVGDLLGEEGRKILNSAVRGGERAFITLEERLGAMDAMGVDMEVLSVNPFWYGRDRDLAEKITTLQNEKLAELCASKPDRFAAFASLALQFPDLAVRQLETAVRKQGLRGAAIGGTVGPDNFSDPKFHPVWAKAEELGAVLFIHPQGLPELSQRLRGNGWLANGIGNPLETTIALEHLIFEGTLDRFPALKIIAAHGGGYLPSYPDRFDHACEVGPAFCNAEIKLKKKPSEYLRQIYVDSLVFTPEALTYLASRVGVSQIVLGSDHPFPWAEQPVDHVLATRALTDDDKAAILGGNAERIFGMKA